MNGNQNNIGGPAPLPGEPASQPALNQRGEQDEPEVQPQPQEPKPTFVTPPPLPPPLAPQPLQPPQPRVERAGLGPNIPSSPQPDIGIRTMASDLKSLKSSGGYDAKPETFRPEEFNKEPMFEPRETKVSGSEGVKPVPAKSHSKVLFISLGIIVFVALAGAVIYFLVLPIIFPKEKPPVVESPVVPVDVQPLVETNPPLVHQSFFIASTPAYTALPINLTNLNLVEMNSALSAASSSIQLQTAREVALTVNGSVPEAASFLSVAFPEMDKNFVVSNFEKDFTVFLYRDVNGSWPGYIFRLSPNADLAQAADVIKVIETSTNIPNLYLTNPGTSNPTGFRDGLKIGGKAIRYLSFNAPGSSFDYGWLNNYLIVTTSFDGFKEALKLLGSSS